MNLSFERKLKVGFGLALVCAITFATLAYRTVAESTRTSRSVAHSHELMETLASILASISEAESSSRGYFVTEERDYKLQFEKNLRLYDQLIVRLEELNSKQPLGVQQIPQLREQVQAKIDFMNMAMTFRDEVGFEDLRQLLLTRAGKDAMDAISATIREMEVGEARLLRIRSLQFEAAANKAIYSFILICALIVGLLVLIYGIVKADFRNRYNAALELGKARDLAVESSRLKSEFLATMSHEIRTPMNGIIGMTNLLLDTPLSAEQKDFAQTARSSADSLLIIINDILDFSKIEAGKLHFEVIDFDLNLAVEGAVDLLAERANTKGLQLAFQITPEVPRQLRGDAGRLRQILVNLLSNAIKFTEKGEVVLKVTTAKEVGRDGRKAIRFEVTDTGIGLAPESKERLFQPFTQADSSTTRKYGGTGLGLAIAKQLVERMNGEIGVESTLGKGSRFWFTAMFAEQAAAPEGISGDAEQMAGVRVLIVDENQTSRNILYEQLLSWRMAGEHASSAEVALNLLRENITAGRSFQVVLLDTQLSGVDGLDLARTLRKDPLNLSLRIILLSSIGHRLPRETLNEAGIDDCLIKPIKPSHLFDSIRGVIARRKEQAPLQDKAKAADQPSPPKKNLRVLLVEDNAVNQKVGRRQLEKLGYTVDSAMNGLQAVEAIVRTDYDVVLMDCQMPEMDGYEATQKIRQNEKLQPKQRRVPIIAMTANAMQGDREKCLAAGMDDYISKPVRTEELAEKLAPLAVVEIARA